MFVKNLAGRRVGARSAKMGRLMAVAERLESRQMLASAGLLLQADFNSGTPWPLASAANSTGVTAAVSSGAIGTVDVQGGTTRTGAMSLTVSSVPAALWSSELSSGRLTLANTESRLQMLTLSFDLSVSATLPVKVKVQSFNASGQRTGGLETLIDPAAPDFYQRFAVELSKFTPSGAGVFNPTAPSISFSFELSNLVGWSTAQLAQIRLDNVNFSKPAYFVSPTGNNNNSGRTEALALRSPQRALDLSQPGDIILIMDDPTLANDYTSLSFYAMQFSKGGSPAAWVSVKNYPGHTPVFYNEYWDAIKVGVGTSGSINTGPGFGYIEVRGLTIRGNANGNATTTYASRIGLVDPKTNGNGLSIDGRYQTNRPHHIRFADNIVENNSGGGIGAGETDWVQIENNISRNNAWWMIYAGSGISVLSAYNFDGISTGYTRLVRNNITSGNQTFVRWSATNDFSDGNGIIIDLNRNTGDTPNGVTRGRTLVANNLSYNNGGSGIHTFKADKVDVINNTAYLNSASPELEYGQIFANQTVDNRLYNNILVAPVPLAGQPAEPINGGTNPNATNQIVYRNNIYNGGNIAPRMGAGDQILNPLFVAPSIDPATANFQLQASSPGRNFGTSLLAPNLDLAGRPRTGLPDAGAYEYYAAAPVIVTAALAAPMVNNGTTLGVYAADDGGMAGLTYTWSALTKPSGAPDPTFTVNGTNAANLTSASFVRAGNYVLNVNVADGAGNITASAVSVTVAAVLSGLTVSPTPVNVVVGGSRQFTAAGIDQFGQPMAPGPVNWAVTGAGNVIVPNGLFFAGQLLGTSAVTVTGGGFSATASVTLIANTSVAPTLMAVDSVKTHGTVGTFDVLLSLSATRSIESRYGGASTLIFAFSKPIKAADNVISANEFSITNATFSSASISGSVVTLELANVVDASYSSVSLIGIVDLSGNVLTGTSSITIGNLYGDANNDGVVTSEDELAVKAMFYSPLTPDNYYFDLDASGYITIADARAAKNRLGNSLPVLRSSPRLPGGLAPVASVLPSPKTDTAGRRSAFSSKTIQDLVLTQA